jgi:hypothetical protein
MNKQVDLATAGLCDKYLELNKGNVSARVRYAKFLYLVGKYVDSMEERSRRCKARGSRIPRSSGIEGYNLVEMGDFPNAVDKLDEYFKMQACRTGDTHRPRVLRSCAFRTGQRLAGGPRKC